MKKITIILMGLLFMCALAGGNYAFSFSITKPVTLPELAKFTKGSEFVKLSFKQYAALTGKKENLFNKFSFNVLKMTVKHELKKDTSFSLTNLNKPKHKMGTGLNILLWIAGILLLLVLIIAIIFGGTKY